MKTHSKCKRFWMIWAFTAMASGLIVSSTDGMEYQLPRYSPSTMVSDQLATISHYILTGSQDLTDDEQQRARILLDLALEVTPDDATLWRMRRDLARLEEDKAGQMKALKRYLALAPADEVSQFDYVRLLVDKEQTIEGRIAKMVRILEGPGADRLSKPLRSRLASYCAIGFREMGEVEQYRERLKQALQLDPTNREAAESMYLEVMGRHHDLFEKGAALMWVIRADPLGSKPRRELGQLLLDHAAYYHAANQFKASLVGGNRHIDEQFYHDLALSLAALGTSYHTREALAVLTRYEPIANLLSKKASGETEEEELPDEMLFDDFMDDDKENEEEEEQEVVELTEEELTQPKLPLDLALLRLVILQDANATLAAKGTFQRIVNALNERLEVDEQAELDRAWLSVWLGPDGIEPLEVERLEEKYSKDEPIIRRILAWMALNRESFELARQIFTELPHDPYAIFGTTLTYDENPGDPQRLETLHRIVQTWPSSIPAMLASRALVRYREAVVPLPVGQRLADRVNEWPQQLRNPTPHDRPWISLSLNSPAKRYRVFNPITTIVTLRNETSMALGLGSDRAIPTRLFTYTTTRARGRLLGTAAPTVVELDRRLTLGPGHQISVPIRLDRSTFGSMLRNDLATMVEFTVRAILDPRPQNDGTVLRGALGAEAMETYLQRWGETPNEDNLRRWLNFLAAPEPTERIISIALLQQASILLSAQIKGSNKALRRFENPDYEEEEEAQEEGQEDVLFEDEDEGEISPEQIDVMKTQLEDLQDLLDKVGDSLNDRFPSFNRLEKVWSVMFLPQSEDGRERFAQIHEMAQRSEDPLVRLLYLTANVKDSESELLNDALRSENPTIAEYAGALKQTWDRVAAAQAAMENR